MNDTQIETLEQVRRFLEGTEAICFEMESKETRYRWTQTTLVKFRYLTLGKADKGLLTQYLRNSSVVSSIRLDVTVQALNSFSGYVLDLSHYYM